MSGGQAGGVFGGDVVELVRVVEHQQGVGGQTVEQGYEFLRLSVGQADLGGRRDRDTIQPAHRLLAGDIELADRLDLVPEKLDSDRVREREGEQVNNPPAHGDIAALADLVLGAVPERQQPLDERRQIGGLADRQLKAEGSEMGRRESPLHDRPHRSHHDGVVGRLVTRRSGELFGRDGC